jgi:ubiquinone/menaquinone biosynthesis C-methylase UbiE
VSDWRRVSEFTDRIKQDWAAAAYYDIAESESWPFWADGPPFERMFRTLDLTNVIELGCGHGRHAARIRDSAGFGRITLVDVNQSNIAFCRRRFAGDSRFVFLVNSGSDLATLPSGRFSSLFCYDSMVHFECDDVLSYLTETFRVLQPGALALLHHSNYDQKPGADYCDNPHWRNFMSASLLAHTAMRRGFRIVEQQLVDWGGVSALDCVTLLLKPRS